MAEITIRISDEEVVAMARAITLLNEIQHLRYMSRSMLSAASGIKDSKVRAALQEMVDKGYIEQYAVTTNLKRQRYYYVLTDAGKELLGKSESLL